MAESMSPVGRSGRLEGVLADLLRQSPELEAAAVVSFDGLPMASALPSSMDEDRVAAMSAALLSLGERAAEGLGRGDLSQVYIEAEHGTVFLVSADDEAVLVAVASKGAKVGLVLFELKRAAAAVASALAVDVHYQLLEAPVPAQPVAAAVEYAPAQPVVESVPDSVPDSVMAAYDVVSASEPLLEAVVEPQTSWTSYATGSNGQWA